MYKLVSGISVLIRQFCIPNPFEPRADALFLNLIAEPIMHIITYGVVGIFYKKYSAPALGSFLYLSFYCIHTGLLMLMGYFGWSSIAIGIIATLYICILAVVKKIADCMRLF